MNKLKLRKLILIFEINWMRKYLIKFLILCINTNVLLIIYYNNFISYDYN